MTIAATVAIAVPQIPMKCKRSLNGRFLVVNKGEGKRGELTSLDLADIPRQLSAADTRSFLLGAVIVEFIFLQPGVGSLMLDAVLLRDYTLIQGAVLFFATVIVVTNLLVDLSYAWLDPRIRYR